MIASPVSFFFSFSFSFFVHPHPEKLNTRFSLAPGRRDTEVVTQGAHFSPPPLNPLPSRLTLKPLDLIHSGSQWLGYRGGVVAWCLLNCSPPLFFPFPFSPPAWSKFKEVVRLVH